MKSKYFKYIIIFLFVLCIILLIPYISMKLFSSFIQKEGINMLGGNVKYDNLSISLIKNFPLAYIKADNILIINKEKNNTISADNVSFKFDIFSIFKSKYEVSDLKVSKLNGNFKNFQKESNVEVKENKERFYISNKNHISKKIFISSFDINNSQIIYNFKDNYSMKLDNISILANGVQNNNIISMAVNLSADKFYFYNNNNKILSESKIQYNCGVDVDSNVSKYILKNCNFDSEFLNFNSTGNILFYENKSDLDLFLNGNFSLSSIIELFYSAKNNKSSDFTSDSSAVFSVNIKGKADKKTMPVVTANINIKNGSIYYLNNRFIDNLSSKISLYNDNKTTDNISLSINDVIFNIDKNKFSLNGKIADIFKIRDFDLQIKSKVTPSLLNPYTKNTDFNKNSIIQSDINLKGSLNDIYSKNYDKLKLKGSMKVSNTGIINEGLPKIIISLANIRFLDEFIKINDAKINLAGSTYSVKGKIYNLLESLSGKKAIKGSLDVKSAKVNTSALIKEISKINVKAKAGSKGQNVKNSNQAGSFNVNMPLNSDFTINASLKSIENENIKLQDTEAVIKIKNGKVTLESMQSGGFSSIFSF